MPASRAGEPRFFLDHDGRVYLVRDGAALRLPTRAEVPVAFAEKHRAIILGQEVVFASPLDKSHHEDWPWKDALPHMDGADAVARTAGNVSQTRVVAKGVFVRSGRVLLIKDKVGFYQGKWSLPGGYVDHGEGPERCVVRELEEEVGVQGEVVRLLRVDSQVVPSGFHFLTFHYEGRALTEAFKLKQDEVEEARWASLEHAARDVASPHSRAALQGLLDEGLAR